MASIVVVMEQPLSSEAIASLATSVLPRRMPCWSGNDSRMTSRFFSSTMLAQAARRLLLLFRPQAVTFDETQRVVPLFVIPGDAKHQTRNLEIPGSMLSHRPGMTVLDHHSAADRCRILPAISLGTGAAHGAPRRRLTSTSIQ